MATEAKQEPLKLGEHVFREFDGIDAAFGAGDSDYPKAGDIPDQYRCGRDTVFNKAFSTLFFKGGKLDDFGLRLKDGVDKDRFYTTLRALMSSFAPKHQVKEGTVAWFLSEYTEPTRATEGAV